MSTQDKLKMSSKRLRSQNETILAEVLSSPHDKDKSLEVEEALIVLPQYQQGVNDAQ